MGNKSLKELIIPKLAKWLKLSPAAIYERQRVLMRAGLLESKSGRGPGSGVRATPESVAMLLIALVAASSLSETAELTGKVASLKSNTKRCRFTGKKTFFDALTAALSSEELAARLFGIEAERGEGAKLGASIWFKRTPEQRAAETDEWPAEDPYRDSAFGEAGVRDFIDHSYEYEGNRVDVGLSVHASLHLPFAELAKELRK